MAGPGSKNNSSIARPADDFYQTPIEAIRPLLAAEKFSRWVWDPACGSGTICKALIAEGYRAIGSNLIDRGYGLIGYDFLKTTFLRAPTIFCNPPFHLSNQFLAHALSLDPECVVMLLPTARLEGQERWQHIYRRTPPAHVYQFVNRVIFYAGDTPVEEQPGWSDTAFAWFVWRRGWRKPYFEGRWIWAEYEK